MRGSVWFTVYGIHSGEGFAEKEIRHVSYTKHVRAQIMVLNRLLES